MGLNSFDCCRLRSSNYKCASIRSEKSPRKDLRQDTGAIPVKSTQWKYYVKSTLRVGTQVKSTLRGPT
jgi:hypothetical protein